ncbi:MAG: Na+:solute symporter [Ignavibacteria bacterium]|jgi:Na+/proline symporter
MELKLVDIIIILLYLSITIFIGFLVSKRASKDINNYFLGGNKIPWYILGISNASGQFDITGTMWLVYLIFVYGLKGSFIPWLWPIFNQIFLMVFLSAWLRRSNVMTGAEWIKTRFGNGKGAQLSHIIIVVFAIVSTVGFLAYAFKGIGKFSSTFLPWELSADTYALILMGITTLYVIKGGMYSVVLTEIIQFSVMTISSIAIGIIAFNMISPGQLAAVVPEGWKDLFFGWKLNLDWTGFIDEVNNRIASDGYSLFTIFFMMMLFKGFLLSVAGPAPNYDMQRILATKSPSDACKMSWMVSIALYFPRYMMIGGLAVLALVYMSPELNAMGADLDIEMILPYAIRNFIPTGLLGILLAGLLAAFMSTYAATVNAAPAYIVNDIYKKYINPNADRKKYVTMSYLASLLVVIIGIAFGFVVESINSITQWIVNALWGGYTASNILKWYWWRFNGYGYFWGMVIGILASLITPLVLPDVLPLYAFPYILAFSLVGCIAGSLLTEPDDEKVLIDFYTKVRPWGFWKPIYQKIKATNPDFQSNKDFKRDMFNVAIGIIWQLSMILIALYLIIQEYYLLAVSIGVLILTSLILKFNWYDRLKYVDNQYDEDLNKKLQTK